MTFHQSRDLVASDPVAAAVEVHLRNMQAEGFGDFTANRKGDEIVLTFAAIEARGETYDVALLRLAGTMLDSADLCSPFLAHMRNPSRNPPAALQRKNHSIPPKPPGRQ